MSFCSFCYNSFLCFAHRIIHLFIDNEKALAYNGIVVILINRSLYHGTCETCGSL